MGVAASTPAPNKEILTPMPRRENGLVESACAEHILGSTMLLKKSKASANRARRVMQDSTFIQFWPLARRA
jgi:hypothetical protein